MVKNLADILNIIPHKSLIDTEFVLNEAEFFNGCYVEVLDLEKNEPCLSMKNCNTNWSNKAEHCSQLLLLPPSVPTCRGLSKLVMDTVKHISIENVGEETQEQDNSKVVLAEKILLRRFTQMFLYPLLTAIIT